MEQMLTLVDARTGEPNGKYEKRGKCHEGEGIKHQAIQIILVDDKDRLILHMRSREKISGGKYDAPTTHVLKGEAWEKAARRCLKNEYGIEDEVDLALLGKFSYKKKFADNKCENESCLVAYGCYGGELKPNGEEMDFLYLVKQARLLEDLKERPRMYPIWFKKTFNIYKNEVYFGFLKRAK